MVILLPKTYDGKIYKLTSYFLCHQLRYIAIKYFLKFTVFIILTTITFVIIVVQFYATIRLIGATKKENNVGTDKTICLTKFWYYLNILLLLLGSLVELITFQSQPFWALIVGIVIVFIRVYMLWTAKMYLKALEECVAEGANIELQAVYAASISTEENQSPAAPV